MLKLTRPKSNPNLFYVSSESGGEKHIVVRIGNLFFCDCKNYMVAKLPTLGTASYGSCKHGKFVNEVLNDTPASVTLVEATKQDAKEPGYTATGVSFSGNNVHGVTNKLIAAHAATVGKFNKTAPVKIPVSKPVSKPAKKKFVVSLYSASGMYLSRSASLPAVYATKEAAQKAVDEFPVRLNYKVEPYSLGK